MKPRLLLLAAAIFAAPVPALAADWLILAFPATSGADAQSQARALGKRCKGAEFWTGSANLIGGRESRFIVYAGPYPSKPEATRALASIKRCVPKARVLKADFSEPE